MIVRSAEVLETALHEALASLEAVPSVLTHAVQATAQASEQRQRLTQLRRRVGDSLHQHDPVRDLQAAHRGLRGVASATTRRLKMRLFWLQLRLFWRAARVFVFGLLLLALFLAGFVWAVRNGAWIVEQARTYFASAPTSPQTGAAAPPNAANPPGGQPPAQSAAPAPQVSVPLGSHSPPAVQP